MRVPNYSTSDRRSASITYVNSPASVLTLQAVQGDNYRLPRARHSRSVSPHRLRPPRRQRRPVLSPLHARPRPTAIHIEFQIKRACQLSIALFLLSARTRTLLFQALQLACRALALVLPPRRRSCRSRRGRRLRVRTLARGER